MRWIFPFSHEKKVMERIDIKSLNLEELTAQLKELGLPAFRAKQIYQWVHEKLVASFDDMTNLSKGLRDQLKERYELITLQIVDVRISQIDGTRKYLFGLPDGHIIESVLMKYKHGNSVCISSQVGCVWGAVFVLLHWMDWREICGHQRC